MIEIRLVAAWGNEETLGSDGSFLYLDVVVVTFAKIKMYKQVQFTEYIS